MRAGSGSVPPLPRAARGDVRCPWSWIDRGSALLGAEMGADYITWSPADFSGKVLHPEMVPFRHDRAPRSVKRTCALVATASAFLKKQHLRPLGLGVGVQGMMDVREGVLRFFPNLGWHDVPVGRLFR